MRWGFTDSTSVNFYWAENKGSHQSAEIGLLTIDVILMYSVVYIMQRYLSGRLEGAAAETLG